jgi:DHA2 family methylenomycin A resistance protein-like MFS transporter
MVVAATVNFLGLFGLFATNFLLTLYLQTVNGLSAFETGVRWLALTVPIMVTSFLASVLTSKVGARRLIVSGSVLAAGGLLGLSRLEVGSGFGSYWWALTLLGAGVSMTGAPATVVLLASVPQAQAGTASGIFNTFRQLGAVFGVALSGALLLHKLGTGTAGALAGIQMPDTLRARVVELAGNGDVTQLDQLPPDLRGAVLAAVGPVFMDGMRLAMVVAAVGTLLGGALTWPFLSRAAAARRAGPQQPPDPEGEDVAEVSAPAAG